MTILNNGVGFQLCHLKLTIEENKMLTSVSSVKSYGIILSCDEVHKELPKTSWLEEAEGC